jgi:hypothetical protein
MNRSKLAHKLVIEKSVMPAFCRGKLFTTMYRGAYTISSENWTT